MQGRIGSDQAGQPVRAARNIRLTLAFDGTAYHGWQIQKGALTVQGILRAAIERIAGEPVKLTGSGRTDSGTHARAFVANFLCGPGMTPAAWARALNSVLPRDIRVLSARRAALGFDARRDAYSKIYRYQMYRGRVMPPHLAREHYHYPYPINVPLMARAARLFLGERDFASFAKQGCEIRTGTTRRIDRCELRTSGRRLIFTVEGSGFLHHMVRNMVGTLLEIGRRRMSLEHFEGLFQKRDRNLAGFTAPAHGLILLRVRYPLKERRAAASAKSLS